MRASLDFPFRRGGAGACVVVGGGGGVVVVTSVVVVTGATVVSTSVGGSVNPVIMSSATISSGFTVVTGTEAIVVTTGATVVSTLGASVVVVSWGGAQETPAASSRVTKNSFMFISFLASQTCSPALCQQSLRVCLLSGTGLTDQSQGRHLYL